MIIVKIALGLLGLGVVVFIHELGHFLAARLVGIDVEAFSIGWGNPLLKKTVGGVEYRLGMFPIGGYCKMRGEKEFQEAWESRAKGVAPIKETFYGANPLARILVAAAGPLFNLLFAVVVLAVIWGTGFEVQTLDSRIVLASEFTQGTAYPADAAGFKTGDRIIEVNGEQTSYYHEVQALIATNPEKTLPVKVERQGETLALEVRPSLDKSSGAGRIGVYFWTDPVIDAVAPGSDAAIAGLLAGDRITAVNGHPVNHTIEFMQALETSSTPVTVNYIRAGVEGNANLILSRSGDEAEGAAGSALGIMWTHVRYKTPILSPPAAVAKGAAESWKTLVISLRSLALLFKGIELTEAVSGPVRITYMVGDVAAEGFGQSFGTGLRSIADFLALISIALCVMNLLPLPILDGGLIVLSIVEIIQRKPIHPRAIYIFQTVGAVLVFGLMIIAVFGDILYLARR